MAKAVLYNPHKNQKKIHDSINKENHKYYVINIGRQFGKTLLAINQMLFWALNNKGITIDKTWYAPDQIVRIEIGEHTVENINE